MEVIVELKMFDGIGWLAEYTYVVNGHRWKDQKRFNTIFKKDKMSKGAGRRYPPLFLR